jgi:HK97 family phage major capsid protein
MALKIDSTVFVGTGADSALFSGIMLGRTGIYSQVFGSGSTNFSELLYSDLTGILAKVPELYIGSNGTWYMNQAVFYGYVANLKDDDKNPLFVETRGGNGVSRRILGYPVKLPSKCWSSTATGRSMMTFGDLKGVYIGRRLAQTTLVVDPYTAMNSDETKFYFRQRWGFAVPMPKKLGNIMTA